MPHVQPLSRRIGKLHQRIEFRLGIVVFRRKGMLVIPDFLPFCFNFCGIVPCHIHISLLIIVFLYRIGGNIQSGSIAP